MGQCLSKEDRGLPKKQNKDIDDKRMFKVGVSVMEKDFCIQIGFSRRAVKNYNDTKHEDPELREQGNEVS